MILEATAPMPTDDLGHLLPDDPWAIVAAAAEVRAKTPTAVHGFGAVDRTIWAKSHGGTMRGGPRLGVLHSAETPLSAGYAYSIAANWFATKASTSAHVMIDPAETIKMLNGNTVSYAVGPRANGFTYNVEQAGRAAMDLATWTGKAGAAQMGRVAGHIRDVNDAWGIPMRWASDAEIHAAAAGGKPVGWCTHDDIRRVLGGTTHYDPGKSYPRGLLMDMANRAGGTPAHPVTPEPTEEKNTMDAVILNAAGARAPVLFWHDLPVELWGKEEKANLVAAGISEVWVEKGTLDALIAEARR